MSLIYPVGLPIALSLTGYNAFLTGLIVLLKRKDKPGIHYFITSFMIFLWGVGVSFMLNNDLPPNIAESWGDFSQIAALFIPSTWLHFVLSYTEQEANFKKWLISIYAITFLILPFTFTRYFIPGYRLMVGVETYPMAGPAYVAFTFLFVSVITASFGIFGRGWRLAATNEKKSDYKMVCFASLYGFLMGGLSFLPVYGIPLPQYNFILMPLWQFMLAYAMIRYRAFDIEALANAVQKDKLAAIGTLAASINHEIRNPLYVIKGLAESHLANLSDGIYRSSEHALEKSSEIMGKTVAQATRAMDIMKSFAVFAKQGVNQEAKTEQINLNEVIEDVLPLVRHEFELQKIEFRKNMPADAFVKADRRHLEEIFFNLIVNSCQAMKESGGKLEVAATEQNGHINIVIKDNGLGMSSNHAKKIFEPFYTTKEDGTGLGLYITKQLLEKNNGRIEIQSKEGQGTSFTLTLPAK